MERPRLLLIDDDQYVGSAFAKIAQSCGYETQVTSCGADFKAAYQLIEPHVIICDLAMPGSDGIELLRFLADSASEAKILIISGLDRRVVEAAKRLADARGLRIAGTFNKPVPADGLRLALNGLKFELFPNG